MSPSTGTPGRAAPPSGRGGPGDGLLRMAELAERADVSAATVKHYVREGLLPEPVRTSRNMAWYPPAFVDRIRLVKRLQDERFMPLRAIRDLLREGGPDRAEALLEHERRLADRALEREEPRRVDREELLRRSALPPEVLDKLVELDVVGGPADGDGRAFDADDLAIADAFVRFRAGGYGEDLGFTAHDAVRYLETLGPLADEEARTFLRRLATRDVEVEAGVDLLIAAREPLHDLVGALHSRLLRRALVRGRGALEGGDGPA